MTSTNWTLDASCLEQVACPLCSGRDFERLAHTDRYAMGLVTVGCLGCGLVMTNPQPTTDALVDFYANHYRHTYLCEDGGQRERAAPTLAYIHAQRIDRRTASTVSFLIQRGALKPGMVVLDIGASEGSMLKTVDDRVPLTRRIAIEPDPVFGSFAVQHAGCELHTTLDALLLSGPPPIDLIVLNHVLEHIKNPVTLLSSLRPLLAPNGRIYIDVPDISEYRKLSALHFAHLYHFGADTLSTAAAQAGYAVDVLEKHAPPKHPRSLRCVLSAVGGRAEPLTAPAPVNRRTGWPLITACSRHAWFAHGKRWLRSAAAPLRPTRRSAR